jgi:hypothetical protein
VWVHGVFDVDFEPFKEFVFLDFYFDNMIGSIVVWSGCFSRLEVIWDFHDFGLQPIGIIDFLRAVSVDTFYTVFCVGEDF